MNEFLKIRIKFLSFITGGCLLLLLLFSSIFFIMMINILVSQLVESFRLVSFGFTFRNKKIIMNQISGHQKKIYTILNIKENGNKSKFQKRNLILINFFVYKRFWFHRFLLNDYPFQSHTFTQTKRVCVCVSFLFVFNE